MPWSGSDFQRTHNFSADASAGINILASRMDAEFDNYETGLEACLKLDGTNAPASDFPMGGYKHTNVGAATSTNQYLRLDQFQQLTPILCQYGGVAEAMSISTSPVFTALVTGHCVIVSCTSANTTTSVTIALNGLTAKDVRNADGTEISYGAVQGLRQYIYNGTYFALMNRPISGQVNASISFTSTVFISGTGEFVCSGSASFSRDCTIDSNTDNGQMVIGTREVPTSTIDTGRSFSIQDVGKCFYHATTSTCSLQIQTCASVAYPIGCFIMLQNGPSGGVISVSAQPGVTFFRAGTGSAGTRIASAACDIVLQKVASDTFKIFGNGIQ